MYDYCMLIENLKHIKNASDCQETENCLDFNYLILLLMRHEKPHPLVFSLSSLFTWPLCPAMGPSAILMTPGSPVFKGAF